MKKWRFRELNNFAILSQLFGGLKRSVLPLTFLCNYPSTWSLSLICRHLTEKVVLNRTVPEAEAPVLWPPDSKSWLIRKDPDAGKGRKQRRRGWQRTTWLGSIPDSMTVNLSKIWEIMKDSGAQSPAVCGFAKSQTQLNDWTTTMILNRSDFNPQETWPYLETFVTVSFGRGNAAGL